ncbi:GNAT family N-acetyltransferase [Viridibacillus sp. YIM B01967]|uniref:GNAT family N-acetyltransferase n=2 Tax=Viridibacillus soli TaxID=2798301 RepID=A0ABS1H3S4_9BACL|nr:GNAT family N-acetyltransferase [Viridibacillus soli]
MRIFNEKDIETIQTWFEDSEVQRRLDGMLPLHEWYGYVKDNIGYRVWMGLGESGQSIGIIMVEQDIDFTGNIAIIVNPILRGKGYGRALIGQVMVLSETQPIKKWFAGIEEDNIACLKCFQSIGYSFEDSKSDEDGYYSLIYFSD